MAKLNHQKRNQYDKIDHYAEAIERNQLKKKKPKKDIKLGIHENHNWQVIKIDTGPHAGKVICNDCNGKFVTWLPKGSI